MERSRRRDRVSYRRSCIADMRAVASVTDPMWALAPDEKERELNTYARTFLVNDEPAAVLGMQDKWGRVAMAWSVIDRKKFEGNYPNTRRLVEFAKHLIDWRAAEAHYQRVEILVGADDTPALEFARALGFEDEGGRMHRAGVASEDLQALVRFWE